MRIFDFAMSRFLGSHFGLPLTVRSRRPGPFFAIERTLHSQSRPSLATTSQRQSHHHPRSRPSSTSSTSPPLSSSPPVPASFTGATNPYTSRKSWPPDFSKLSTHDRFRYEKTFRRRSKLKWARPRWIKFTKILQWGLIWATVGYWVFFLKIGQREGAEGRTPFEEVSTILGVL